MGGLPGPLSVMSPPCSPSPAPRAQPLPLSQLSCVQSNCSQPQGSFGRKKAAILKINNINKMNQIQHNCPSLPQTERSSGGLCSSMDFGVHQLVLLWAGSPSDAPGPPGEGLAVPRLDHPRQLRLQLGHQVLPMSKSDGANAAQLPPPGGYIGGRMGAGAVWTVLLLALSWRKRLRAEDR